MSPGPAEASFPDPIIALSMKCWPMSQMGQKLTWRVCPLLAQGGRSYANEISWSITNEWNTIQFPTGKEIAKTLSVCSGAGRALAKGHFAEYWI
jgi:hypothetical protein